MDDFIQWIEEALSRALKEPGAGGDPGQRQRREEYLRRTGSISTPPSQQVPRQPPGPQEYGVSFLGAERYVSDWLRHRGVIDAEVTQQTRDHGIDVASAELIVQVKHLSGNVGVQDIRQLQGVSSIDGRLPLFFSSRGYTAAAHDFAGAAGMPLFTFNAETGTVQAMNQPAETWLTGRRPR